MLQTAYLHVSLFTYLWSLLSPPQTDNNECHVLPVLWMTLVCYPRLHCCQNFIKQTTHEIFKWGKRWMGFWDAVASTGPYANNLHLAPDRQHTTRSCNYDTGTTMTTTTTTVWRPLYRWTCVSRHLQLRTGGFYWCMLEFSSIVLSTLSVSVPYIMKLVQQL